MISYQSLVLSTIIVNDDECSIRVYQVHNKYDECSIDEYSNTHHKPSFKASLG